MKKIFCLAIVMIILFTSVSCGQEGNYVEAPSSDETNLNCKYEQNNIYDF